MRFLFNYLHALKSLAIMFKNHSKNSPFNFYTKKDFVLLFKYLAFSTWKKQTNVAHFARKVIKWDFLQLSSNAVCLFLLKSFMKFFIDKWFHGKRREKNHAGILGIIMEQQQQKQRRMKNFSHVSFCTNSALSCSH